MTLNLTPTDLLPVVQRALNTERVRLSDWQMTPLSGGMGGGVGGTAVYHLSGQAQVDDAARDWSVILKLLVARPDEQPSDSHYWRREAVIYQSDVLDELPPTFGAPRCLGVDERGESVWLWLEALTDATPGRWTAAQHLQAAHHVGQFNGTYAARSGWGTRVGLSRDWIRQDVARFGTRILTLEPYLTHPLLRDWLNPDKLERQRQLWQEREGWFARLERLPHTLCHYDAFRRNLFAAPAGTLAVDWSFTGPGPLGADLVPLFWVNAIFEEADMSQPAAFAADLFDHYLAGLRQVGWDGDAEAIREGYVIALALRQLAGIGIQVYEIAERLQCGEPLSPTYIASMTAAGHHIDQQIEALRQMG